jgi:hypothetical protein
LIGVVEAFSASAVAAAGTLGSLGTGYLCAVFFNYLLFYFQLALVSS